MLPTHISEAREDKCRRLEHPEIAFADSYRKMPQQNLRSEEIEDLVAYLRWVSAIENNDWPPQNSETKWASSTRRLLAGAVLSPGAALVQEGFMPCAWLKGERGDGFEYLPQRTPPGSPSLKIPLRSIPGSRCHLTLTSLRNSGDIGVYHVACTARGE
jgi:nitric oxide reductase subunit C